MEARNRRLPDWLTRIRTRQVVLPRFQRMEAWGYREVSDLLLTVLNGLPAGAVLTLEVGDKAPFFARPMRGAPETGERISELLLDGQQRLTALWRSLTDDYPDRTYFVVLDDGQEEGIFVNPVARWTKKDGRRYPLWAESPAETWQRRHVPVRLLRPDERAEAELWEWAGRAVSNDPGKVNEVIRAIMPLRARFAEFNLPFLALPVGTLPEVALNVFIKMNTTMIQLTAFDIIVAQVEEVAGQSLHDLVSSVEGSVPRLSAYATPSDLVLSVAALLQDRPPNEAGYMGLDLNRMIRDWPPLVRGAQEAVRFLEQERVPDYQRLPTMSPIAPIVALWCLVPEKPDARGNAQILLRKYLWRAFFTDRYERAAATAALQDYRALRGVLSGSIREEDVPCFDLTKHPLPDMDMLLQAGWPRKRDRLARAILLLSLRGGALDFADGAEATREHLKGREYHHLFPVAHLGEKEYGEGLSDYALNCALVTWKTNRAISAKAPLEYLLERAQASSLGEPEVRRRLITHMIPYDSLAGADYQKFLHDRAKLLHPAIEALCQGEPWPPPAYVTPPGDPERV